MRALARIPRPTPLPWSRPRHELVLLVLVAAAALSVVLPPGAQDGSRMCLTRAVVHVRLSADSCLSGILDRAEFGGRLYSDKPPGVSVLAVPAAEAVRLPPPPAWHRSGDVRLWLVRLSTGGLALMLCAFLLGRVSEGLRPGLGGVSLVTFAAGTLASSLAVANFDEVPTAAAGFAAFILAWGRRPLAAGLLAGLGILLEYQSVLIAAVVGLYLAAWSGRALARYLLGLAPGLALLGTYDWAAFGSPFHLSYRYVSQQFARQQGAGFFGIHSPSWHAARLVLIGDRGLLVDAPVLVPAALGLVVLWRRGLRAEAAACWLVALAFLAIELGYYTPYGGDSPGPRFFIPALPFLAIGLAPAFAAWRRFTLGLALISVISSTAVLLTWPGAVNSAAGSYRWSVWRELGRFLTDGSSSEIATWAQKNVLSWVGVGRLGSAAAVFALALTAFAFASSERPARESPGAAPS